MITLLIKKTVIQSFTLPENISNTTNIPTVVSITVNVKQMAGDGVFEETAFEIRTVEDLCLVGRGVDVGDGNQYSLTASYKLMNDLDITKDSSYADPNGPDDFNIDSNASTTILKSALTTYGPSAYGFVPIASGGSHFQGTFDGGNHTITNLYINISDFKVGLFSYSNNATIKNLGLVDVAITGNESVGGLIGRSEVSTIDNCYVTGSVTGSNDDVGGLVGYSSTSTIKDSYATASVAGKDNVGGLVGVNEGNNSINTGIVNRSYAKGNVSGNNCIGGLVGYNNYGDVEKSYASGVVSGAGYVGGLMGQMHDGRIYDSYAIGNVNATGNQVGGLIGSIPNDYGNVMGTYATGNVAGADQAGGLIGYRKGIWLVHGISQMFGK